MVKESNVGPTACNTLVTIPTTHEKGLESIQELATDMMDNGRTIRNTVNVSKHGRTARSMKVSMQMIHALGVLTLRFDKTLLRHNEQ